MRITTIFEVISEKLYAVHFDYETPIEVEPGESESSESAPKDELVKAFGNWSDAGWLWIFFSTYRDDLRNYDPSIKVKSAVALTISQAKSFHSELIEIFETQDEMSLNELFQPLDNREMGEIPYELQKLKAKKSGSKSWLRLYAVRYGDAFVITGSAIKLTDRMNERTHLKEELHKLKLTAEFLGKDGHECAFVYLDI